MPFGLGKARVMTGAIGHLHSVGSSPKQTFCVIHEGPGDVKGWGESF